MNKDLLRSILLDQQKIIKSANIGIQRHALTDLQPLIFPPHVVVISGLRRVGKSTLLAQLMQQLNAGEYYCNFEDERLLDFQVDDFNQLYETFIELHGEKKVWFFDEIQNVPGWERFIRRMHDAGMKFFITGSNASLLSKELGTRLTGRVLPYTLFPFSFQEYLLFNGHTVQSDDIHLTTQRGVLKKHFSAFLKIGGMPGYVADQNPSILKEVYDNILYRDIITRYDLTDIKALRELSLYLLSNVGKPFSYQGIQRLLDLGSVNTVKNYVHYLENTFLFFTIHRYNPSVKKQLRAPKKVYSIDTGFMNTMGFQFSENRGRLLENMVFMELQRRTQEVYYYTTLSGGEVDFLTREENKITELIQVCWEMNDEKTKQREVGSLLAAMDEFSMNTARLLSYDTSDTITHGKKTIIVQPVYQWLLEE